ncbi:MAG: multidrug effflux MFS transporter [Pseudomonadota bacterium]
MTFLQPGAHGQRLSPFVPFILAACTGVSILSTDLFTPSIPDLPRVFGTNEITAQYTVSINLLAYSLAQLVHGPMADTVGRRRLLLIAFGAFVLSSVFCALASSIELLLWGRFLQGLFSSVPSVVIILMIRELYPAERAVGVMALYGAALGIAPALGPLLGGYLFVWFGWSGAFWVIALLAAIVLALFYRHVPESLQTRAPLRPLPAIGAYLGLLTSGNYLKFALPLSLTFGALFAYVTTAPVVFIDLLDVPEERYGISYIFIIAGYVLGNVLASRLSKKIFARRIVTMGVLLQATGAVALAAPVLYGVVEVNYLVGAMTVFAAGLGMIMASGPLVVLDLVRDRPQGPAAALLGTLQLAAASGASFLSSTFYNETALSLVLTIALFVGLAALPLLMLPDPNGVEDDLIP